MKQLLFWLLCFSASQLAAQSDEVIGTVEYTRVLHYDKNITHKDFTLYVTSQRTLFIEVENESDTASNENFAFQMNEDGELEMNVSIFAYSPEPLTYETDTRSGLLRTLTSYFDGNTNRPVLVEEAITTIPWQILNETRVIANLECQKAVGKFRGREYTVWFTRKIPVRFGPWKLQGLPGLILEATDKTNQVQFLATKIDFPAQGNPALPEMKKTGIQTLTLEEYVQEDNKMAERMMSKIGTKLPRGAMISMTDVVKHEIELEYEFDQNK